MRIIRGQKLLGRMNSVYAFSAVLRHIRLAEIDVGVRNRASHRRDASPNIRVLSHESDPG